MKHCSYDFLLNFCNSIAFTFNEAIQNPLAIKTKKKKKKQCRVRNISVRKDKKIVCVRCPLINFGFNYGAMKQAVTPMSIETPTKSGNTDRGLMKKLKEFDGLAMSIGNGAAESLEGGAEHRLSQRFVEPFACLSNLLTSYVLLYSRVNVLLHELFLVDLLWLG